MPPKRPADGAPTGAQLKRQRMRDQRAIPVQREGGSAARGNDGLPPTIDVDKFAQARNFEITAMQRALKNAKSVTLFSFHFNAFADSALALDREASTQRAFQSLPRHLRRRAASHNIRRLPSRLRAKAKTEVPKDAAKPKKKSRKLIDRKLKRLKIRIMTKTDKFVARQRNKIWLETHIWHTKRMHMTTIWGHRLALKPTMKAFRASYRASVNGALLVDASYYQYLEMKGSEVDVKSVLGRACGSLGPAVGSKRYSNGARELNTQLYSYSSTTTTPSTLIGPCTIIWDVPASPSSSRSLLIRLHPSICAPSRTALSSYIASLGLKSTVELIAHEKAFNTFEVTGKRGTEVVKAMLGITKGNNEETKEAWKALDVGVGPGGVPEGMIWGLEIWDPRLSFPPKLVKPSANCFGEPSLIRPSSAIASLPSFWDATYRSRLNPPTFTKRELDSRRSELLLPGTSLSPIVQDDRIPVLLSQSILSPSSADSDKMAKWTLTFPSGHGMSLFSSLVFSETRVGGLRERGQSHFEAGLARFPEDYPGTRAFDEYEERREVEDRGKWERRPPAKRCNWVKVGTETPWKAGLEAILKRWNKIEGEGKGTRSELVPKSVVELLMEEGGVVAVPSTSATKYDQSAIFAFELSQQREGLSVKSPRFNYATSLVRVKVEPYGRGSSEELGLLYWLDDERWKEVRTKIESTGGAVARAEAEDELQLCKDPTVQDVCGRITTGNFSLKRGRGFGVGVLPLSVFLDMVQRDLKSKNRDTKSLCLMRNRDGQIFRAATLELMM